MGDITNAVAGLNLPDMNLRGIQTKLNYLASHPWFHQQVAQEVSAQNIWMQIAHTGCGIDTVKSARTLLRSAWQQGKGAQRAAEPVAKVAPKVAAEPKPAKPELTETQTKQGDTWEIELPKSRRWTQEEMETHYGIDTAIWECTSYKCAVWNMGAVPRAVGSSDTGWSREDGELKIHELYSSRGTWKKRAGAEQARDVIREFIEDAKKFSPRHPKLVYPKLKESYMLELSLPDAHFGKLCWGDETGGPNYDTVIAEDAYKQAILELMAKVSSYHLDKILLPIGNDLMNVDNAENTTTGGTPQSVDGRYPRTFRRTWQTLRNVIDDLVTVAPVEVVAVPGNHDRISSMCVAEVLSAWYHTHKHVTVNNDPPLRKYCPYGNTLLVFTHGSEEKRDDLPLLSVREQRELAGKARFVEIHLGHLHKTQLNEKFGVRVRILPSLCAPDGWHSQHGFVGNIRSAEAYVWSKDRGLAATAHFNLLD